MFLEHILPLEPRLLFAAGDIDTHFGNKGSIVLSSAHISSQDLLLDASGGIILATVETRSDEPLSAVSRLRRFTSRGSLDPAFQSPIDNQVILDAQEVAVDLALAPGGFVLSIGNRIERFRADGSRETSFGDGGIVTLPSAIGKIGVQRDGAFVASGTRSRGAGTGIADPMLTRILPDGSPDASFGAGGQRVLPIIDPNLQLSDEERVSANVTFILPDPGDGSAYAIGTNSFSRPNHDPEFPGGSNDSETAFLVHINADGSFDSNLDGDGILEFVPPELFSDNNLAAGFTGIRAARVESTGRLAMLATSVDSIYVLFRIAADGSVLADPAPVTTSDALDSFDGIQSALLLADGSVIVARDAVTDGPSQFALQRWNRDLSRDASFKTPATAQNGIASLYLAQDGSILSVIDPSVGADQLEVILRRIWRSDAPAAELEAPAPPSAGNRSIVLTVNYRDDGKVATSSLDNRDLRITGPNGFVAYAKFDRIASTQAAGGRIRVRYKLTPPGGSWDAADNGTYAIRLRGGQVFDDQNHGIEARTIGSFAINIGASSRVAHLPTVVQSPFASTKIQAVDDDDDDEPLISRLLVRRGRIRLS